MADPATPAPPPAARVSTIEREVGRHRIMERALRGWRCKSIAQGDDLTRRRVGQIVRQTLELRESIRRGPPHSTPGSTNSRPGSRRTKRGQSRPAPDGGRTRSPAAV